MRRVFDEEIISYLDDVSKTLHRDARSKSYSDVVTFSFWCRRASMESLAADYHARHKEAEGTLRIGRGSVFHIAPSNVPVNFAYSLVAGLLAGNENIVRVPSKDFPQVTIIEDALNEALTEHESLRSYVQLVRYDHDRATNDAYSASCDVRIIWGGDETIAEIRKSPLPPRATEITFADRYSLAVIDADAYLLTEDKEQVARDFYNDTYFSDQNACTSPRIVLWTGAKKEEARAQFWEMIHALVQKKYPYRDIQGVDKLTNALLVTERFAKARVLPHKDNLLTRVELTDIPEGLMDFAGNSGFFFEYCTDDLMTARTLFDDNRCQTVAVFGDATMMQPILTSGVKGVDRVVRFGHTMDFSLTWDGHDLITELSRAIPCT